MKLIWRTKVDAVPFKMNLRWDVKEEDNEQLNLLIDRCSISSSLFSSDFEENNDTYDIGVVTKSVREGIKISMIEQDIQEEPEPKTKKVIAELDKVMSELKMIIEEESVKGIKKYFIRNKNKLKESKKQINKKLKSI
jgi:hypothetical protein